VLGSVTYIDDGVEEDAGDDDGADSGEQFKDNKSAPLFSDLPEGDGGDGSASLDQPQEEVKEAKGPTPLSLWEEKRNEILHARQEKADQDKAELLLRAKEELKGFYEKREAKVEKDKKQNRQDEKSESKDYATLMESGTRWQKVNKLVDLRPKKDHAEAQKTDRMRLLLTQLKTQKDPDEEQKSK